MQKIYNLYGGGGPQSTVVESPVNSNRYLLSSISKPWVWSLKPYSEDGINTSQMVACNGYILNEREDIHQMLFDHFNITAPTRLPLQTITLTKNSSYGIHNQAVNCGTVHNVWKYGSIVIQEDIGYIGYDGAHYFTLARLPYSDTQDIAASYDYRVPCNFYAFWSSSLTWKTLTGPGSMLIPKGASFTLTVTKQ